MFNWVGKVFRFKDWADWERSKSFIAYFKELFERFFTLKKLDKQKPAQFKEVVERYHLSDEDLNEKVKFLKLNIACFLSAFLGIFSYGLFHLYKANFFISLVVFCISLIAFSLTFRYHFYLTLIQNKRLNCTIKDWFKLTFKRE
jgi:intracellular multiplication protein IcmV